MSRHKYPRIGRSQHERRWAKQPAHEGPRCIVCGEKATHVVHLEFSYMRGDDEVLKACGSHCGDANALAKAWADKEYGATA